MPHFQASFASFSEFTNDERTRTFLSLEVGAGHHELSDMLSVLSQPSSPPQRDFYNQPRFHASIAWALLDPDVSVKGHGNEGQADTYNGAITAEGPLERCFFASGDNGESNKELQFPRILRLPSELIPTLHERFGARLSSEHTGAFDAETVAVKIGKDIFSWPLQGTHLH